jgi:hypothetical protein
MNLQKRFPLVLVFMFLFVCSCSNNKSTEPQPVSGKITATAAGITGQNGNVYAVSAYDSDWFPGSEAPVIAGFMVNITNDNFSSTQNLLAVDNQAPSGLSSEDMLFEPGTYSVVFFVATLGNPPQHFAEVRVTVNGDVTANAPNWSSWAHP